MGKDEKLIEFTARKISFELYHGLFNRTKIRTRKSGNNQ